MPYCNPYLHDRLLDAIRTECNKMVLCSQVPTTFTEANTTYALADVAMSPTDFTIANGDVSGRKITVAAKSGVPVDVTGDPVVCALLDTVNQRLLYYVDETGSQTIYAGNTVNIPSFKIENRDPVNS